MLVVLVLSVLPRLYNVYLFFELHVHVYAYIEYSQMPKDVLRTVHSYTVLVHGGEHVLNIVSRYELSS